MTSEQRFNPADHTTTLKRRQKGANDQWQSVEIPYLEVKWRVVWLRSEHPEADIITELVQDNGTEAVFKAFVSVPSRGSATGWGSEEKSDWKDYREKAETKALGRALAAMGYGAAESTDFDDPDAAKDAEGHVERPPEQPSREFWVRVLKFGKEQPGLGYVTKDGKLSEVAVHRALGLADEKGSLAAWVAEGHTYDQAWECLKAGKALPMNGAVANPDAPLPQAVVLEGLGPAKRDPVDGKGGKR